MSVIIQIYDGSQTSTTNNTYILHGYTVLPHLQGPKLYYASKFPHDSIGFGYVLVPTTTHGIVAFYCMNFTPSLPTTVISPNLHLQYNKHIFTHKTIKDDLHMGQLTFFGFDTNNDMYFDTQIIDGLT